MTVGDPRPVRVVRAWVRFYTGGLPADVGDRRRLELESDMWEQLHDAPRPHVAWAVVGRWLRGIPADVGWRYRAMLDARHARTGAGDAGPAMGWWVVLTALFAATTIVASVGAAVFGGGGGGVVGPVIGGSMGVVAGGVVFAGLVVRRRQLVTGSWLVITGCIMALDPLFIPFAALVIVGGLWTTDLQLSESVTQPAIVLVHRQRERLTRRWYVWLAAAPVLFGFGLLFPLLVFTESSTATTDHPTGLAAVAGIVLWMTWWFSWLAAAVCAGVGTVLAVLRGVVRHRARLA